jgi:uncharacterized RDD family membrane protein YckC
MKRIKIKRPPKNYKGHETARMLALEGVPLASFWSRGMAFLIDFFLTVLLFAIVAVPTALLWQARHPSTKNKDVHFDFDYHNPYSLVAIVLYFGFSLYWGNGRTLGKRLLKIRVVSLAHEHLSIWHCLERALGYGASALEGGLGFLQYFTDPACRTVHDRIAGTIVIDERRPKLVDERPAMSVDEPGLTPQ